MTPPARATFQRTTQTGQSTTIQDRHCGDVLLESKWLRTGHHFMRRCLQGVQEDTNIHTQMHTENHTPHSTHTHTHTHTHLCTRTHTCTHIHTHTHTHTYTHLQIHTNTYIQRHTYKYIHTITNSFCSESRAHPSHYWLGCAREEGWSGIATFEASMPL